MSIRFNWITQNLRSELWVTITIYCIAGIAAAIGAVFLDDLFPATISSKIGADAVDRILGIIAASMLAVTTFSISTMVQAFASAGSGATPRATQLIAEDPTARRALGAFIGAFVFSLVGLIALSTGTYGAGGRLVLFGATVIVVSLIIVMLLRWIHRLSRLGRLGETIELVENATIKAIDHRRSLPLLGGRPADEFDVRDGQEARSEQVGYIQRIDTEGMSDIAEKREGAILIKALPGTFVATNDALAVVVGKFSDQDLGRLVGCFQIGKHRLFDQDPRFGLVVLSEIGSRAASPAVNDPGTAIVVVGTMVRVLPKWGAGADRVTEGVKFPRLHVPKVKAEDLLDDGFMPIARDGAGLIEVGISMQKAFKALGQLQDSEMRDAARRHAMETFARAERALVFPPDIDRLKRAMVPSH